MAARTFTLAKADAPLWADLARRMGGCAEGCDWFLTHSWDDVLRDDIKEPYPIEWAYWGLRHMGHRASGPLRDLYLRKIATDPHMAMVTWQHCPDLAEKEAGFLFDVAAEHYPAFVEKVKSGELTLGSRAERDPKLSDPDG